MLKGASTLLVLVLARLVTVHIEAAAEAWRARARVMWTHLKYIAVLVFKTRLQRKQLPLTNNTKLNGVILAELTMWGKQKFAT
jgi:hypothetical protein